MMTYLFVAIVLFQRADPVMEDQEDLAGEWKVVRIELGGGKSKLEELAKGGPVEITGGSFGFGDRSCADQIQIQETLRIHK